MKKIIFGLFAFSFLCGCSSNKANAELKIGDKVPMFSLYDKDGNLFNLASVVGTKYLVIYFYPKDDTPGCTKEACTFRDQYDDFSKADAIVIGISGQSVESHKKFAEKHQLSFTLLADEGNKVRELFGVPANLGGMIPGRVTYVVDKNGTIIFVFNSQSDAVGHVSEALKAIKGAK